MKNLFQEDNAIKDLKNFITEVSKKGKKKSFWSKVAIVVGVIAALALVAIIIRKVVEHFSENEFDDDFDYDDWDYEEDDDDSDAIYYSVDNDDVVCDCEEHSN